MEVRDQEFKNGALVREVVRQVPDPSPSREERVQLLEAQVAALTEALQTSGDAKLEAVATRITARTAEKQAERLPGARVPAVEPGRGR